MYERHDPFAQALHPVVRENLATFYAAISSGDMKLNPHLLVVALDGLYVAGADGRPVFRALGRLKTDEVADVVQIAKRPWSDGDGRGAAAWGRGRAGRP